MKLNMDDLSESKLTSSHAIENMFIFLIAISLLSFSLVSFVGGGWLIDRVVGASSIAIAVTTFAYTFSLYGIKSKEGWVWLILSISLLLVLAGNISDALGYSLAYFILRFISIPAMIGGLMLKLKIAGLEIERNEQTIVGIAFLGWTLLTVVSAVLPALEGGFNWETDMYAIFAFAELFAVLMAMLVILTIRGRGWYYIASGLTLIAMGDIFHPLAQANDLIYPGSPVRLLWYVGLLVGAFGAYHQRKQHLKMMAL